MTPACVDIFSGESGGAAASPSQMSPPVLPLDTARLAVCLHAMLTVTLLWCSFIK